MLLHRCKNHIWAFCRQHFVHLFRIGNERYICFVTSVCRTKVFRVNFVEQTV